MVRYAVESQIEVWKVMPFTVVMNCRFVVNGMPSAHR